MSGFFKHVQASGPASWWKADLAERLGGPDDGAEELAFELAAEARPAPDVFGHDPIAVVGPMLSEAALPPEVEKQFAEALARMLDPADACELAERRSHYASETTCPAGLLFASPRPAWEAGGPRFKDLAPIEIKFRKTPTGLSEARLTLLQAAVLNLAGQPAAAIRRIEELPAAAEDEALANLLALEREASAVLSGESDWRFSCGYNRVIAHTRGWQTLGAAELVAAIAALDVHSPWRWAAMRLALPTLRSQNRAALRELMAVSA